MKRVLVLFVDKKTVKRLDRIAAWYDKDREWLLRLALETVIEAGEELTTRETVRRKSR